MNMPNKFIKSLVDKDYNKLVENYQTSDNFGDSVESCGNRKTIKK